MTPEGKIKAAVKKTLKKYPNIYAFWPVQSGYGAKTLDCLLCIGGYFVAIETKAPGKKPTELQNKTIDTIRAAGGFVVVISGVDELFLLEMVIERLYGDSDTSKRKAQDASGAQRPSRSERGAARTRSSTWGRATAPRPTRSKRDVPPAKVRISGPEPNTNPLSVAGGGKAVRRTA